MKGGSLTRYHTPILHGKGFGKDLMKLAGPSIIASAQHGLQALHKGANVSEALTQSRAHLTRGLKRKLPAVAKLAVKSAGQSLYKKARKRTKDILGY